MDDFISRKLAIQSTSVWNGDVGTEAWIRDELEKLPAADVRPVVRGKWEDGGKSALFPGQDTYRCSECDHHYFTMFNFCPNCGADMRPES